MSYYPSELISIVGKLETAPGTVEVITDVDYDVLILRDSIDYVPVVEQQQTTPLSQTYSGDVLRGANTATLAFEILVPVDSEDFDTHEPAWWKFLRASGLIVDSDLANRYVYPDDSSWGQTITLEYNRIDCDGNRKRTILKGCIGRTVKVVAQSSKALRVSFDFEGVFHSEEIVQTLRVWNTDPFESMTYTSSTHSLERIRTYYKYNTALSSDQMPIGPTPIFNVTTALTVTIWFKESLDTPVSLTKFLSADSDDGIALLMAIDTIGINITTDNGLQTRSVALPADTTEDWQQYTVSFEQSGGDVVVKTYYGDTLADTWTLPAQSWELPTGTPNWYLFHNHNDDKCLGNWHWLRVSQAVHTPAEMREIDRTDIIGDYYLNNNMGPYTKNDSDNYGTDNLRGQPYKLDFDNNGWAEDTIHPEDDIGSIACDYDLELNNSVTPIVSQGYYSKVDRYFITESIASLSINPYIGQAADFRQLINESAVITHKMIVENNRFNVLVPRSKAKTPKEGDRNGIISNDIDFVCMGSGVDGKGYPFRIQRGTSI